MEELLELKQLLLQGDIKGSLIIVEELEEMGKKDIVKTIRSYAVILLLHLIKPQAENRTTRSWDVSISNSVEEIKLENKRRKAGAFYLDSDELIETLEAAWSQAIKKASLEANEGIYAANELEKMIDKQAILDSALSLISSPE